MSTEIERKFLVTGDAWRAAEPTRYRQGYLNRDKQRTVRVRMAGARATLTVKGITHGASRAEFEYQIPVEDAQALLTMCDGPLLEKNRYRIEHAGITWEVDEFLGQNAPLIVAEVELESESQQFDLPDWIGEEVTGDARYYNVNLATAPYRSWVAVTED